MKIKIWQRDNFHTWTMLVQLNIPGYRVINNENLVFIVLCLLSRFQNFLWVCASLDTVGVIHIYKVSRNSEKLNCQNKTKTKQQHQSQKKQQQQKKPQQNKTKQQQKKQRGEKRTDGDGLKNCRMGKKHFIHSTTQSKC